jgi:hypothetical protein
MGGSYCMAQEDIKVGVALMPDTSVSCTKSVAEEYWLE